MPTVRQVERGALTHQRHSERKRCLVGWAQPKHQGQSIALCRCCLPALPPYVLSATLTISRVTCSTGGGAVGEGGHTGR